MILLGQAGTGKTTWFESHGLREAKGSLCFNVAPGDTFCYSGFRTREAALVIVQAAKDLSSLRPLVATVLLFHEADLDPSVLVRGVTRLAGEATEMALPEQSVPGPPEHVLLVEHQPSRARRGHSRAPQTVQSRKTAGSLYRPCCSIHLKHEAPFAPCRKRLKNRL